MREEDAYRLAATIRLQAPWVDHLSTGRSSRSPGHVLASGDHSVLVVVELFQLELFSPEQWARIVAPLLPDSQMNGTSRLRREAFVAWLREQVGRRDLPPWERPWPLKLDLYVDDPANRTERVPVEATVDIGTVEITVTWTCPLCGRFVTLREPLAKEDEDATYRLRIGPLHQALGTDRRCPEDLWVEFHEPEDGPLSVQVWSLEPREEGESR